MPWTGCRRQRTATCKPIFPGWVPLPPETLLLHRFSVIGTGARSRILAWESRWTPARRPAQAGLVSSSDLGVWFSPRLWPFHGWLLSRGRNGRPSQALNPAQDRGEQRPRHRHLGQLEDKVAAVA